MEEQLIELGFSKNEAKVYLALLELGTASASRVASRAGIHRPNAYESLQRLVRKGLASYLSRGGTQVFEAADPELLLTALQQREAHARELVPHLRARALLTVRDGSAAILRGVPAFAQALNGCLEQQAPIKVYGIPKDAVEMMRTSIPHFHAARLKKRIVMQHIYNFDAQERIRFLNKMRSTQARYIDDKFKSNTSTLICGSLVIITDWNTPVFSVRIDNEHIASSFRHYFEILWKNAVLPD